MFRSFHLVAIAVLTLALPLAALAGNNLNLDTGAIGSSGGDIVFNPGTSIAPVGSAKFVDLTPAEGSMYSMFKCSSTLASMGGWTLTPITGSNLAQNDLFLVHTNGGNYAAVVLTAVSSTSVTLQYDTCTSATQQVSSATGVTLGGPGAPTVSAVLNNYSSTLPNAPNYGIAPGTLMVVYGSNLAAPGSQAVLQDSSKGLPLTLNGSSVSVTVGGKTVQPAFYYALPTQLAVVLPSNTPVGTGTITVSYGGQTSAAAPLKVVASAFGFDYYGGALAAVTDSNYSLITTTHSAIPGQTYVFPGDPAWAPARPTATRPTRTLPTPFRFPALRCKSTWAGFWRIRSMREETDIPVWIRST